MRYSARSKTFGILVAACLALTGCKVNQPGKMETRFAQQVKHSITIGGKNDKNPLAATPENIAEGKHAFGAYCIVCHGLDGQNTGVPFADRMAPPVPSLASPSVQSYKDGQLKYIIENGVYPSGMPASKDILSDEEIWTIVLYIRHLPPAGSLGEPAVYGGGDSETPDSKWRNANN